MLFGRCRRVCVFVSTYSQQLGFTGHVFLREGAIGSHAGKSRTEGKNYPASCIASGKMGWFSSIYAYVGIDMLLRGKKEEERKNETHE